MKKNQYLKLAFKHKLYRKANWLIRNLSEFAEPPGQPLPTDPYTPMREMQGLFFLDEAGEKIKIDDYSGSGPLFIPQDKVVVDESWAVNIEGTVETDFGILITNAIMIWEVFGGKLPYINGEVSVSGIEKMIAPRLANDPNYDNIDVPLTPEQLEPIKERDFTGPIYAFENNNMSKGIELLASVMELFTVALTEKTIMPPTGIDKFKAQLIKEYGDRLNDPIVLAEYEERLKAYDAEYLKDDPSFKKFTSGKILNDSRKKLYLGMGAEGGFAKAGEITAITESLSEGIPRQPDKLVAAFNGARAGSFSRGAETVEGGVAAKKMLNAAINYVIVQGDCGSKLGLERIYDRSLVGSLRGRTIIYGNKQVKVPMDADTSAYLGQTLITRSPMYCKTPGERICSTCAGDALARYETGVALPLTEISAAILAARMKAMHTNALKVNDFDLDTLFT